MWFGSGAEHGSEADPVMILRRQTTPSLVGSLIACV